MSNPPVRGHTDVKTMMMIYMRWLAWTDFVFLLGVVMFAAVVIWRANVYTVGLWRTVAVDYRGDVRKTMNRQ